MTSYKERYVADLIHNGCLSTFPQALLLIRYPFNSYKEYMNKIRCTNIKVPFLCYAARRALFE